MVHSLFRIQTGFAQKGLALKGLALCGMMLVLALFFSSGDAFAQAQTFGEVQQNIGKDLTRMPPLFAIISYIIGVFFAADGLLKLRAWMESSEENPINAAIFRLAVSALLIYLPHGIVVANNTLFGDGAGGKNIVGVSAPKLNVFQ